MSSVSVFPPGASERPRSALGGLRGPVEVRIPSSDQGGAPALKRLARITAVIPCHNRPEDARTLLADLSRVDTSGIDLRIVLVDNASTDPLSGLSIPPGLTLEHLRLNTNTGGSGGYNAGLVLALAQPNPQRKRGQESPHPLPSYAQSAFLSSPAWPDFDPDYVWLVDSDARVFPDTLGALLEVLAADPSIIAAGPAIADPLTGRAFELGGRVNRRTGIFEPMVPGAAGVVGSANSEVGSGKFRSDGSHFPLPTSHLPLVPCDYLAACCALVRADAVRCAGLLPDTFLNGDDVEWFIRMAQRTGGRIVAVPHARALHPRFDRFPTWTRYYTARNALGPLAAIGAPRSTRLRRALRAIARAAQQELSGRSDLARLHLLGLKHAAAGRDRGPAPEGTIRVAPAQSLDVLIAALRGRFGSLERRTVAVHPHLGISDTERAVAIAALEQAGCRVRPLPAASRLTIARRWLLGPPADIALLPARGRPDTWFAGRMRVLMTPGHFTLHPASRLGAPCRAAFAGLGAVPSAIGVARRKAAGPSALDPAYRAAHAAAGRTLSVEAIVLSYNRWPALQATVERLLASPAFDGRESDPGTKRTITIIDNASTDGTPERIEEFLAPRGVRLIRLDTNRGVEAFNLAAAKSTADAVLILDDDATPDEDSLLVAIDHLASRPDLGAVTLHPRHPKTRLSEWPFASRPTAHCPLPTPSFPLMGCANLVRRAAWSAVGGYEADFFLYRNDADLALKLLASGRGVYFDPALVVWHDTPAGAGARKGTRWHELATRNWVWMAKRHARGLEGVGGALAGWLWAHKLAGFDVARQAATLRGAWIALVKRAPALNGVEPDGAPWRTMIRLLLRRSEN